MEEHTACTKRKRNELSSSTSWKVEAPKMAMKKDELWIGDLPPEIIQMIFGWIPPRDLVKVVPLVCKFWNKGANEPMVWMDLCNFRGLDGSIMPGGVTDWRRFYFTPNFTFIPKNSAAVVSDKKILWKGQGTVISDKELPTTGVIQWQVRVLANQGSAWVCFGVMEPKHVSTYGDGDWMPSYSFCTCCDGYPKGLPRWDGTACGKARDGDVFTLTVDTSANRMKILGPRGVDMERHLPPAKYVLYFTVSAFEKVELVVENAFYCTKSMTIAADGDDEKKAIAAPPPVKKRREDYSLSWKKVKEAQQDAMMQEEVLWIGDLPPELLDIILSYVPAKDLFRIVPQVCKYWYNSSYSDLLWMKLCEGNGLDGSTIPSGVSDWRRFYFTPNFTLQPKRPRLEVHDKEIEWKGQGTCVSSEEIPLTGVTRWQVRVLSNTGATWVCFGLIEPQLVRGDGDWMPSYSFCTCCDGYPKGQPRWNGKAVGTADDGDVFTCTVDRRSGTMNIVGPNNVDMTRALPPKKYVLYFTVATRSGVKLRVENVFHSA